MQHNGCHDIDSNKVMTTIALHSTFNVSETIRDRGLIPKDHEQKMAYGLSNGHVTDDVT